ncbi:hypothetical protein NXS15_01245 [Mycoplasma sp. CSL7475-4]|uniref:hypothetical protein n=1 Tax=Mycoplasma sp. CSL7475-4 TaxID=2973942 RepID=UPI00216B0FF4|nr:hypothetical protein [Mycoplasma sp. CSL7475-4]MCS4536756.1 hypothetical protein [Mycoplasma sp. CSL7475-4]
MKIKTWLMSAGVISAVATVPFISAACSPRKALKDIKRKYDEHKKKKEAEKQKQAPTSNDKKEQ